MSILTLAGPHTPQILRLFFCSALMTSANITIISTGVLGALTLLGEGRMELASLAIGFQFGAQALSTLPSALLMARVGRRTGFLLGTAFGLLGSGAMMTAFLTHQFWLLCLGGALHGIYTAFAFQYRFAASDLSEGPHRPRAISMVVAGGILAALIAPTFARLGIDLIPGAEYAGSFLFSTILAVVAAGILAGARLPPPVRRGPETSAPQPGLRQLMMRRNLPLAMIAAAGSFGMMNLLMTMTPPAMAHYALSPVEIEHTIRLHVLGMFVPSLFTGWLINRFGLHVILLAGCAVMAICIAVGLSGVSFHHFWVGLLALGIGWNWLFIGGTTLLATCHTPAEAGRVQGINELCVFSLTTLSAFSVGLAWQTLGWNGSVQLSLVLVVLMTVLSMRWFLSVRRERASGAGA